VALATRSRQLLSCSALSDSLVTYYCNMDTNRSRRADNLTYEVLDAAATLCSFKLGSAYEQASTSTSALSRVVPTQLEFPWHDEVDPTGPREQHELRLIISSHRWVASCNMDTFWHEANDLDDKAIASFALLDTFTRWLPHWQGGILHVRTNDVRILREIRGTYSYSGVWHVVWALCRQYGVQMSAEAVEPKLAGILYARAGDARDDKYAAGTVRRELRNPDVVDAAVKLLMASGEQDSCVNRTMLSHLRV